MPRQIRLGKGLDIPIAGVPDPTVAPAAPVRHVALLGGDYLGLKPKLRVAEGERVTQGQTLFVDKHDPEVRYTAPGSGTITAINRGARRALQSVVIELDETEAATSDYAHLANCDLDFIEADAIRAALFASGLWTAFRTRPFSKVPGSDTSPHSIFVTAIDTRPLAADPAPVVDAHAEAFRAGLRAIARLTQGAVYLCTAAGWQGPTSDSPRVQHVEFSGPHPAGAPGTHIHHLDPVGAGKRVWHIGYQDVIAIGKLFGDGQLWLERIVALGGDGFARPRLAATRLGASIAELAAAELQTPAEGHRSPRLISGSVLCGRDATGAEAFLGRYHLQVAAIPQQDGGGLFGWSALFDRGYSFAGLFRRRQGRAGKLPFTTALNGRATALVPVDAFERVMPLDILPVPLLKALLIGNTDAAVALGCLELDAEDLALCAFVCPGKNDYGSVLRVNLERIEREQF